MSDIQDNNAASDRILDMVRLALERGVVTKRDIMDAMKIKGRSAKPLPEFTFKGSGITVQIRRLGPFTIDEIGRSMKDEVPRPEAPKVMVNFGTPEKPNMQLETNEADPEYKRQLAEYEKKVEDSGGRRILDTILRHAVLVDPDMEEVEETKAFLLDTGVSQDRIDAMTPREIYVRYICIQTPTDITDLQSFVLGESVPSEELVRKHEESFSGDVPQQTDIQVPDNIIRDQEQSDS